MVFIAIHGQLIGPKTRVSLLTVRNASSFSDIVVQSPMIDVTWLLSPVQWWDGRTIHERPQWRLFSIPVTRFDMSKVGPVICACHRDIPQITLNSGHHR